MFKLLNSREDANNMEPIYYCQNCGEQLKRKNRYCGSKQQRTGCAYGASLAQGRAYYRRNRKHYSDYNKTEKRRESQRESREKHKAKRSAKSLEWRKLNNYKIPKIQVRAHTAVHRAIKKGTMSRPDTCSICGANGEVHAHHDDYNRPLDVRWLCRRCHGVRHRGEMQCIGNC